MTTMFRDSSTLYPKTIHGDERTTDRPGSTDKDFTAMLMNEELARERIRDMLQAASDRRAARDARRPRKRVRTVDEVHRWAQSNPL